MWPFAYVAPPPIRFGPVGIVRKDACVELGIVCINTVGGALGRSGKQIPEDPVAECEYDREIPFRGTARPSAGGNGGFVELHVESSEDSTALTYDFGELSSSFVGVEVSLPAGGAVDLVHADRIGDDGTIDPHGCASRCVVRLYCPRGRTRLESFEPYCVRYLRVIVRRARAFTLHDVFLRRYQYPDLVGGTFLCSDGKLNRIYEAARLTLRANTVDVFLDTPGRERGGWLCDSFWTARAARLMFGDTRVERAMLENFLAPTVARHFDGYSPAVYSDHFAAMPVRFEILAANGEHERLLREARYLYCRMVDEGPGTLWQGMADTGSVCQGFAAHAGVWLARDFLGFGIPDAVTRTIAIAPHPCGLRWAKGTVKTEGGNAGVAWSMDRRLFRLHATVPPGYRAVLHLPGEVRGWGEVAVNDQRIDNPREPIRDLAESFAVTARP